jgi:hypothetical protein
MTAENNGKIAKWQYIKCREKILKNKMKERRKWQFDLMIGKMTVWRIDRLVKWQNGEMTYWQNDIVIKWQTWEMREWENSRMGKWLNGQMKQWAN